MTQAAAAERPSRDVDVVEPPWTCPFCSLHCDRFRVDLGASLELVGSDCLGARSALAHFTPTPSQTSPAIDGAQATLDDALAAAAARLAAARQPLISGLATDVAGARAAFRLAEASGAIVDHRHGTPLMHAVRAIQDRGIHYTTLAEIREHADLIVCIGTVPSERYPEFFRRCDVQNPPLVPARRRVVFVGTEADPVVAGMPAVRVDSIAADDDIFATIALLNAAVAGRALRNALTALATLADDLRAARYAVVVWEPAGLGEHGALVAEAIGALVAKLNRTTRAASFALGGSDGGYTANHVFTWLSGLPLRTALHRHALTHEPVAFSTERLVREESIDALVWIASFGPQAPPPFAGPRVIIAHPATAAEVAGAPGVFIPVSTPGIGSAGHLFRVDGGIALPLRALYRDTLPTVASVLDSLTAGLRAIAAGRGERGR